MVPPAGEIRRAPVQGSAMKRKAITIILRYLNDLGYHNSVEQVEIDSLLSLQEFDVCDNITLDTIIKDYEDNYVTKYGRRPKLIKRISPAANRVSQWKNGSNPKASSGHTPTRKGAPSPGPRPSPIKRAPGATAATKSPQGHAGSRRSKTPPRRSRIPTRVQQTDTKSKAKVGSKVGGPRGKGNGNALTKNKSRDRMIADEQKRPATEHGVVAAHPRVHDAQHGPGANATSASLPPHTSPATTIDSNQDVFPPHPAERAWDHQGSRNGGQNRGNHRELTVNAKHSGASDYVLSTSPQPNVSPQAAPKGLFMEALAGLHGGPTDTERRQAHLKRERLIKALDEQVQEKKRRDAEEAARVARLEAEAEANDRAERERRWMVMQERPIHPHPAFIDEPSTKTTNTSTTTANTNTTTTATSGNSTGQGYGYGKTRQTAADLVHQTRNDITDKHHHAHKVHRRKPNKKIPFETPSPQHIYPRSKPSAHYTAGHGHGHALGHGGSVSGGDPSAILLDSARLGPDAVPPVTHIRHSESSTVPFNPNPVQPRLRREGSDYLKNGAKQQQQQQHHQHHHQQQQLGGVEGEVHGSLARKRPLPPKLDLGKVEARRKARSHGGHKQQPLVDVGESPKGLNPHKPLPLTNRSEQSAR